MSKRFYVMIYGKGGSAKTPLVVEGILGAKNDIYEYLPVPELMPALYLDVDRSTESVASKLHWLKRGVDDVDFGAAPPPGKMHAIKIGPWEDFQTVYNAFYDAHASRALKYKTLIVDSLTEAHHLGLLWSASKDKDPTRLDKSMPLIQDYGGAHNVLRKMMKALRDLEDLNIIYTAQPRVHSNEAEGIQEVLPMFVGNFAEDGLSIIPNVALLKVHNGFQRVLQLGEAQKHYGKYKVEGGLTMKETTIAPASLRSLYDTLTRTK